MIPVANIFAATVAGIGFVGWIAFFVHQYHAFKGKKYGY